MVPIPTIEDLEKDEAAKAQAVIDAQAAHTEATAALQTAKDVAEATPAASEAVPTAPQLISLEEPRPRVVKGDTGSNLTVPTYDPSTGNITGYKAPGTKFVATGKYETPTSVYLTDGTDTMKATDLGPDPDMAPAPVAAPAVSDDQGEKVEVHVAPHDPNLWKKSYQDFIGGPARYKATVNLTLHDAAKLLPDIGITQDGQGTLVGTFKGPDNVWYYLSKTSKEAQDEEGNGPWYGFPKESLQRVGAIENADQLEDLFDPADAREKEEVAGYRTQKISAAAGTSVGLFNRLRRHTS